MTWAETNNFKPKACLNLTKPTLVKQALCIPHWLQAMEQEYNYQLNNKI